MNEQIITEILYANRTRCENIYPEVIYYGQLHPDVLSDDAGAFYDKWIDCRYP